MDRFVASLLAVTLISSCLVGSRHNASEEKSDTSVELGEPLMVKRLAPMHPGEVLREEFWLPLGERWQKHAAFRERALNGCRMKKRA
jgi:hypothetical protein